MGDFIQIVSKFGNVFKFENKQLIYFLHGYNKTWRNERCIEIPIVRELTKKYSGNTLEIGNVTQNYFKQNFDILDQFEKGPRVINEDVFKFVPTQKYNKILAISTVEHFHEHTNDPMRGIKGIKLMMKWLAPGGIMIVTIPAGFNKVLDAELYNLPIDIYEMRQKQYGLWEQCAPGTIKDYEYDMVNHTAKGLYICVYKNE